MRHFGVPARFTASRCSSRNTPMSYRAVLRTPAVGRLFATALLGRFSYGTVFLSLVLALTGTTGSYAVAGGAVALFGLASSLLSPLRADLIDRLGARRAPPPMATLYAILLIALAVATSRPGTPLPDGPGGLLIAAADAGVRRADPAGRGGGRRGHVPGRARPAHGGLRPAPAAGRGGRLGRGRALGGQRRRRPRLWRSLLE